MANKIADPNGFNFTKRKEQLRGLRSKKDATKFDYFKRKESLVVFILVSRLPR